ncbi:1-acyl-sn-glycerol-3-phosphate acyltransferase [Candidatus Cyanaurora vandensis]|uniref:lysophospholipid acyltransferase family protein n=1 Tax=Candidatus Cyanaurora vandensis TaxID=2714958 RepID=UPI002579D666|nr:1-acyl-sn-glycerol-3-phosphate acyltransferase [Candidatus Cyanaurora vandensis]
MFLYFDVHLHGTEHLPTRGPIILAPVHRSRWDAFVTYCLFPRRLLRFLTTQDEFVGLQSWFMKRLGAFPINTQRPNASAVRHCQELVLAQQVLVIFPEGNLYYYAPDEVHPLKPGAAWLALSCQKEAPELDLPVIPVRYVYSDRVLRFRSRIEVYVQAPLKVRDYLSLAPKEGIRQLTADIQRALGDVVNETPPDLRTQAQTKLEKSS